MEMLNINNGLTIKVTDMKDQQDIMEGKLRVSPKVSMPLEVAIKSKKLTTLVMEGTIKEIIHIENEISLF